jgi:regulator of nucleoside diphosphate kinase
MTQRNDTKAAPRPRIVISARDHSRLLQLAESTAHHSEVSDYLSEELLRADVVPEAACADHIAQMGSTVTYRDDNTGRIRKVQLVYPAEADIERHRISILTPIGAALIGMSPAQSIAWPTPGGGSGSLTVLDVRPGTESDEGND